MCWSGLWWFVRRLRTRSEECIAVECYVAPALDLLEAYPLVQHDPNQPRVVPGAMPKRWRRMRGAALLLIAAVLLVFSIILIVDGVGWLRITGFENSPNDRTTIRYEGSNRIVLGVSLGLPALALLRFAVRDLRAGTASR